MGNEVIGSVGCLDGLPFYYSRGRWCIATSSSVIYVSNQRILIIFNAEMRVVVILPQQ
jgi:hypothetical protein